LRPKIIGGQAKSDQNGAGEIKPGNAVKDNGEEGRQTQKGEETEEPFAGHATFSGTFVRQP
jgi:hypothetical protein